MIKKILSNRAFVDCYLPMIIAYAWIVFAIIIKYLI